MFLIGNVLKTIKAVSYDSNANVVDKNLLVGRIFRSAPILMLRQKQPEKKKALIIVVSYKNRTKHKETSARISPP